MKKRVMLSGAGGFGETYVRLLCALEDQGCIAWVGVVDPYASRSKRYESIRERGIAVFERIEDFYAHQRADLAVICSPIAMHGHQAICAMRQGSDVLLEKPVAATLEEAEQIRRARDETQQRLSIAFQWCYDPVMLRLKALSDAGRFGALRRLRSLVLWPRSRPYYLRNAWAGKNYDENGHPVFDSISANATAHYLFNMLWLAGDGYDGAEPRRVEASLWRANDIDTFDTATIRVSLPNGVQALHVASHAAGRHNVQDPMFLYEYEHATVRFGAYGRTQHDIVIDYADGTQETLGDSNPDTAEKLKRTLAELGTAAQVVCPVEAACKHVAVMEALRAQKTPVRTFEQVCADEDMLWVPGLSERLTQCYQDFRLLSE